MLLETLKALILAGKETLRQSARLQVKGAAVSQVRQGRLSFPALGEINIRSGTVQTVHLGCDKTLSEHLATTAADGKARSGLEELGKTFVTHLVQEMDGRNPRGRVAKVSAGTVTLTTRGVRTFGLRLATAKGQLFLLAEIPSRIEMELAKGSDFVPGMIGTYLPRDWMNREVIDNKAMVDGMLKLFGKLESDIHLEIPQEGDEASVCSGIILEQKMIEGRKLLKISADLQEAASGLEPDQEIKATVGLEDRSLDCVLQYRGPATHPLVGGISLNCSLFSIPESFAVVQRRKAFRIPVPAGVSVEIAPLQEGVSPAEAFQAADPEEILQGSLADLSFSGARFLVESELAATTIQKGQRVMCRLVFPDEFEPLDVLGIVRRLTKGLANRNEWQNEIGLEFLVSPDLDRRALDYIRQYVLSEQRAKLAQRILVGRPGS